jgi:hypothetical protein
MGLDAVPTNILTGLNGSIQAAIQVVTLDHGGLYVIPAGVYWLFATDADMDFEVCTVGSVPTWTKFRDGAATEELGMLIYSDGVDSRLHNSHGATDGEVASLIKIG